MQLRVGAWQTFRCDSRKQQLIGRPWLKTIFNSTFWSELPCTKSAELGSCPKISEPSHSPPALFFYCQCSFWQAFPFLKFYFIFSKIASRLEQPKLYVVYCCVCQSTHCVCLSVCINMQIICQKNTFAAAILSLSLGYLAGSAHGGGQGIPTISATNEHNALLSINSQVVLKKHAYMCIVVCVRARARGKDFLRRPSGRQVTLQRIPLRY